MSKLTILLHLVLLGTKKDSGVWSIHKGEKLSNQNCILEYVSPNQKPIAISKQLIPFPLLILAI